MVNIAFMFPGQGSQSVGMTKDVYDKYDSVKTLFKKADEHLNIPLTTYMFQGPAETLTKTEYTQPALLLSSVALFTLLKEEGITPQHTIGHSLGEYSAHVASGTLDVYDALKLVNTRGKLMEKAYPSGQGSMAAVLGLEKEKIQEVLDELDDVVDMANLNSPGQIVISGTKSGIESSIEKLKEKGAKRVVPLNVSGPFHSRLMQPASEDFSQVLNNTNFNNPNIPVYANVTAKAVTTKDQAKELLVKQLYSPVLFYESIENMIESGIDVFVEVGNGKVLRSLVKKIDRNVKVFSVNDLKTLDKFLAWYKEES